VKAWTLSLFALLVVGSIAAGFAVRSAALLPLINQSFLLGLCLLMAGCLALVIRSGFFTAFARGFSQLKEMFFRKPRVLDNDLYRAHDPSFQQKKEAILRSGTSLLLTVGLGLILFSIVLTGFYYL